MDWQIRPFSRRCYVTGKPFSSGDRYVSLLVRNKEGELCRFDVSADEEPELPIDGTLLCRWRQEYKPEPEIEDSGRKMKATAESLFISLFDDTGETTTDEEREVKDALRQFLALLLERKRLLRNRGKTPDGESRIFEHVRSREVYLVPAGEIRKEDVLRIQEKLSVLVGST